MKHKIAVLFILGLIGGLISCQSSTVEPSAPQYDFSAVDKLLSDSVPVRFGGNCFAIIQVSGSTEYSRSFGPFDGYTKHPISSCTNWLSAAVLMTLVDEGKISLSDPIGKFLPIFTTNNKGTITIEQLFAHTSGFPTNSAQGYETNPNLTLEQSVNLIAQNVPLINTPGSTFYYGEVSMQIAGRICEVASGKSWFTLFVEKLGSPLGMSNTDYGTTTNKFIAIGARSTPTDYMKFLNMIMNKGVASDGTIILTETSIDAMELDHVGTATIGYTPYPTNLMVNTIGIYGIGTYRDYTEGVDILVENCSPGGLGSHPWIDRKKKVTGFIFTNIPVKGYMSSLPTSLKVRSLTRTIVPG